MKITRVNNNSYPVNLKTNPIKKQTNILNVSG